MSDSSVCPVCGGEGPDAHEAKLAHLAAGEEVVSNLHGQADQFRPVLKAINEQRLATPEEVAATVADIVERRAELLDRLGDEDES